MKIIIGATVENISTRQDNSFKIVVGTQEIEKAQVADLFDLRNKYCKILFSDSEIPSCEVKMVEDMKLTASKKRSPSKRLRDVLYRLWQQDGGSVDAETHYASLMERIIEHYKSKLNHEAA